MISYPPEFRTRIVGAFGELGLSWLEDLPDSLRNAQERWGLILKSPIPNPGYSYICAVVLPAGEKAILKAVVPGKECVSEIGALRIFAGVGAVTLIDSDESAGLLLLERVIPGKPLLSEKDDEAATSVFADICRKLHAPCDESDSFPTIAQWAEGFERVKSDAALARHFPDGVIDYAAGMMSDLIRSSTEPVLLHGDLHHWNILSSAQNSWLAIDPKGVLGEAEYECGAWLRNPFPQLLDLPDPKQSVESRIAILSEQLNQDSQRIRAWGYAQAVLSGVWAAEEGLDESRDWLRISELFR